MYEGICANCQRSSAVLTLRGKRFCEPCHADQIDQDRLDNLLYGPREPAWLTCAGCGNPINPVDQLIVKAIGGDYVLRYHRICSTAWVYGAHEPDPP